MAKIDKIVRKMLNRPAEMPFTEIKKVLDFFGFTPHAPHGGRDSVYVKGDKLITLLKEKKATRHYIQAVVKKLNLEEWYEKRRVDE